MKLRFKSAAADLIYDIAGSFIMGCGINCFTQPADIAPGGVTGVSIMLNYIWGLPVGTTIFLLNVPIIIAGFVFLHRRIMIKTLVSIAVNAIILDTVAVHMPVYTGDRLLSSVFGGALIGAGMGIIFLRGSTTGGGDVISYILKKLRPQLSTGTAILLTDIAVILCSVFVFGDFETGLYGGIAVFCSTRVIDTIVYGVERSNIVLIISDESDKVRDLITRRLWHGVAFTDATGGHSGKNKKLILCAVHKNQFPALKNAVQDIDDEAFIAVLTAEQVTGDGFRSQAGEQ